MKRLVQTFGGASCVVLFAVLAAGPALAQQTGAVAGRVTDTNDQPLPGVTVVAAGDVLPRPRSTVTGADGGYRIQLLPPGRYELTFGLEGLATETRPVEVLLDQTAYLDVTLRLETVSEEVAVVAALPSIDPGSAELKSALGSEVIERLPIGQDYRDLVKLVPGVQYSEDTVRGPSAGGSGQDNVYLFDGVNVGLPLFGTLSSEPSSHDIEQISVIRGGAKATDFNRSGGFTIDSVSRSGTNRFRGAASYQVQTDGMTSERRTGGSEFEQDEDWAVANVGGPLLADSLFFYASYFRPTIERGNRSNLYGEVPDFDSERDELFGKLTWTPTDSLILHGSYRDSEREEHGNSVETATSAGSTSTGADSTLEIATLEGSWVATADSYVTFSYTDFANDTSGRPDTMFGFQIRTDGSVRLDVDNLDRQGLFTVPTPSAGEDAFNEFIAPLIERYGFLENGVRMGGGRVGGGSQINDQDFARESFKAGYDHALGRHELHAGYQWSEDSEVLSRTSNGWGSITVPGGRGTLPDGTPIFYEARFEQQSLLQAAGVAVPPIESFFESQNVELNDTIRLEDWTFNVGVLLSNDELYGQGLRENSANVSGFELAPGSKYKMYEIDFEDMISPRLAATWSHDGRDTVYASFARYYPAASSLPRAASWARNNRATISAFFDAEGNLIGTDPVASSSGKFFQPDMDPRSIDEYVVGHSRQLSRRWTAKAHARYRYGANFWEDTNNTARLAFEPPPGVPQELYIPELNDYRAEVGGSTYVIAELDGAFTKYWEASAEAEWRGAGAYFKGSYVWSHYYGNFDQDNTTTENDDNIFIGSSFLADGAGRQIWDSRYGDLRGDRRHQLKLYGYYSLPWNGSAGAYAIYQSGQPWETWSHLPYSHLTGSTSDTSRFAEPAGSRTASDHYQLDLNYIHDFPFGGRYNVQVRADLFNVFDQQTGYNVQNQLSLADFGEPRRFFNPRRLQLMVRLQF